MLFLEKRIVETVDKIFKGNNRPWPQLRSKDIFNTLIGHRGQIKNVIAKLFLYSRLPVKYL